MTGASGGLRGTLGTGAAWGVAWFVCAAALFTLRALGSAPLGSILLSAFAIGAAGLIAGVGFAGVLVMAELRGTLGDLSLIAVAAWGALGAVLGGAPFALALGGPAATTFLSMLGVLGGLSSACTLLWAWAARRGDGSPGSSSHRAP